MTKSNEIISNRILVCDDDEESHRRVHVRCLNEDFVADVATTTLTDLEKVLFGEETNEKGAIGFEVETRRPG